MMCTGKIRQEWTREKTDISAHPLSLGDVRWEWFVLQHGKGEFWAEMPERVCLTSSGIGWKLCPRKKREWGRQHKSSSCSWKVNWAGPEAGNESVTWFKLFCLCRVHNFSQSTRVISWRCPGEKTTDIFMGDHYNYVNGHLSTVTMSDTLTHVTNEVRETQIFQLFLAFKITFQWTFMNLRAERLLQTSFLSKGQCLFWTSQFGRICFAWTFACAGALLDITYPSKIHKPCFRLVAVISLFVGLICITFYVLLFIFLCVKRWQLLFHSLITSASQSSGLCHLAPEPVNILEPLTKADPST